MLSTPLSKATRVSLSQLVSSSQWTPWGRRKPTTRPSAVDQQRRSAHAVAVNPATDFFTSTIPGTSQRTKPVGFDEEPCTLALTDGYGYAQVEIGDRLGPQDEYEIMRKLGWGMYATTWLVCDHSTKKYHALKIVNEYGTYLEKNESTGRQYPRFHEREILERISTPSKPTSRGPKHCLQLVTSFYTYRGDAQYLCLVLELGGMDLGSFRNQIGSDYALHPLLVKSIVKQICRALDYIHTECKVVHTDLKPGNILIGLDPRKGKRLAKSTLEQSPVQRYPPRRIMGETVEAIKSQPLGLLENAEDPQGDTLSLKFKLGDFGSAQWLGRRSTNHVQPIRLRAPEVVLGNDWDEKIDIWSLGCLTYEFLTGRSLFRARGGPTWSDEDDLLASQLEILSQTQQFPEYFVLNSRHDAGHLSRNGSLRNIPNRMVYPKTPANALLKYPNAPINLSLHSTSSPSLPPSPLGSSESASPLLSTPLDSTSGAEERDLALSFIARCLTLDPKQRAGARELLRHPWIRGSRASDTGRKDKARKVSQKSERSLGVSSRVDKGDLLYHRDLSP